MSLFRATFLVPLFLPQKIQEMMNDGSRCLTTYLNVPLRVLPQNHLRDHYLSTFDEHYRYFERTIWTLLWSLSFKSGDCQALRLDTPLTFGKLGWSSYMCQWRRSYMEAHVVADIWNCRFHSLCHYICSSYIQSSWGAFFMERLAPALY